MGFLDGLAKAVEAAIFNGGSFKDFQEFKQRQANPQHYLSLITDENGRLQYDNGRWTQGNMRFTINPTDDLEAPGGTFVCMEVLGANGETLEKATIVFDADGYIADTKSNRKGGWI